MIALYLWGQGDITTKELINQAQLSLALSCALSFCLYLLINS